MSDWPRYELDRNIAQFGLTQLMAVRLNSGEYKCKVLSFTFKDSIGSILVHVRLLNHPTISTLMVNASRLYSSRKEGIV